MGMIKQSFVAVAAVIFVIAFSFEVKSAEPQTKPESYEYTGIIKAKSQSSHLLTVQTTGGLVNFHDQRHGRTQCTGFRELAVGDSVKVVSPQKSPSEATCITKTKPVGASK